MSDQNKDADLLLEDEKNQELPEVIVEHDEQGEAPAKTEEIKPPSIDEGIEALRAQVEKERKRAQEAERREREALQNASKAQTDVHETNIRLVDNAIATKKQESASLKQIYRDALMNGDYDAAADAQEKMATAAAQLLQLENGRQAMENAPRPVEKARSSDPVASFASEIRSNGFPRSAEWIERNPQYVTDPRLNQKMIAAHNLARADGHQADSDGYFEAIEEVLKINRREPVRRERIEREESDASEQAAKIVSRREGAAPPAAPVSRQPPSNSGERSNVVRLTAAQREIAAMNGMTEQEYARHLLALKKEGRVN